MCLCRADRECCTRCCGFERNPHSLCVCVHLSFEQALELNQLLCLLSLNGSLLGRNQLGRVLAQHQHRALVDLDVVGLTKEQTRCEMRHTTFAMQCARAQDIRSSRLTFIFSTSFVTALSSLRLAARSITELMASVSARVRQPSATRARDSTQRSTHQTTQRINAAHGVHGHAHDTRAARRVCEAPPQEQRRTREPAQHELLVGVVKVVILRGESA